MQVTGELEMNMVNTYTVWNRRTRLIPETEAFDRLAGYHLRNDTNANKDKSIAYTSLSLKPF